LGADAAGLGADAAGLGVGAVVSFVGLDASTRGVCVFLARTASRCDRRRALTRSASNFAAGDKGRGMVFWCNQSILLRLLKLLISSCTFHPEAHHI
jgi:hypothetical protein